MTQFYGRTGELQTLEQWIVTQRCRVVALLGMELAKRLGRQTGAADSNQFEVVVAIAKCPAV